MSKYSFQIISDSTSSLDKATREKYDLDYARMLLSWGDNNEERYATLDYENPSFSEYFNIMRGGERIYTDMVTADEYTNVFSKYLKEGLDVLYIGCSSKLSGSVELAKKLAPEIEKNFPGRKIYVVDALTSNAAQKYLVIDAAKLRNEGKSAEEVYKWVEENKYDYQNYATVGTLTYLARAGRVKAAKAFFGNLFSVKPLLYNNRAGENVSYSKAKGRGSIEALALEIKKYITNPEKQEKIYIVHGDCLDDANELKNKIMELIPELKEVEVTELDPIVGASCGPDTLIVGFKGKFVEEVSE